ncbi:uncharacterized protein LOC142336032 [Convolutriloba macropyga]|uniref:uncharacterized protein LOC142336032 n=1 Tax=Convolutriloba macropyga TaxID=536237 RepID=UPI003F51DBFC
MEVILLSDHQGEKLVSLNGFLYTQHSTTGQAIIWRCKNRIESNCPARLRTSVQLTNAVNINTHNHPPNAVETSAIIQLTEEYSNLKRLNDQNSNPTIAEGMINETVNVNSGYLDENFDDQTNELLYSMDAFEADFDYNDNQAEIDPNDPPFEPSSIRPTSTSKVSRGSGRTRGRKRKTDRRDRINAQTSQASSKAIPESNEVKLSSLSGLFGGEVRVRRKKKPNAVNGPLRREMPPEPRYVSDIVIEGIWANTDSPFPERFLLYDNHEFNPERRVILFITDDHLNLLCNTSKVFLESALPVPPFIFAQLLLIQAALPEPNVVVTLGYAFMGSRNEISYIEIFQALKSKARDLGVTMQSFMHGVVFCDYEKPAVNALKRVFGSNTRIQGKFFHLNRITWKKIVDLNLIQCCQFSEDFKLFCAQLVCLAFLPISEVRQGMIHLKQIAPPNDLKVDLLLDWFESTFIAGAVKAARVNNNNNKDLSSQLTTGIGAASETIELHQIPALFPPEIWNVSDLLISANTRTDNILEGSYASIKHLIGHNRPSFYRGIKYIRNEQKFMSAKVAEYEQRTLLPRTPKGHLVEAQQKLSRLLISYRESEIDMATFLLASAKTIRLGAM